MRTQEEINRQVEGLKAEKARLPQFSAFGDNNWENIDTQIAIITGTIRFESCEDDDDDYDAAYDAYEWLTNNGDDLF